MMPPMSPNEAASSAAVEFARGLVANWQAALGSELLGLYLIGSLAHGGFSRRYSDVDMAVIAADPDPLFPRRAVLPAQVDAYAALIASHAS
jgi:predicted nucleotidyltransferase